MPNWLHIVHILKLGDIHYVLIFTKANQWKHWSILKKKKKERRKVDKRVIKKKKQNIPVLKLQSLHAEQDILCYIPLSQLWLLGLYRDVQMSGQLTASLQQALIFPNPGHVRTNG